MNQEAQTEFNRLVLTDPGALTSEERAFLYARRIYLTTDQKRIFADVLQAEDERVLREADVTEQEKNPKAQSKKA